jgi:hypothetical protein
MLLRRKQSSLAPGRRNKIMKCDRKGCISGVVLANGSGTIRFLMNAAMILCFCVTAQISAYADVVYLIDAHGGTGGKGALLSIDSAGHRTIITDFGANIKVGGALKQPKGMLPHDGAVESDGNILLVLSQAGTNKSEAVIRVDPSTGTRILLSDFGNPAQGPLAVTGGDAGMAIAADGSIYVNGFITSSQCSNGLETCESTFKVDPTTGSRTLISDWDNPAQGSTYFELESIAPSSDGSFFVGCNAVSGLTETFNGVVRVDSRSGNRLNEVTNSEDPTQGPVQIAGAGPTAIVQESANAILMRGVNPDQIVRVDVNSGQRTIVSDFNNASQGLVFASASLGLVSPSMTVVTSSDGTYILATGLATRINKIGKSVNGAVVVKVDLVTGNRTVFSDLSDLAQGPTTTTSLGGIMFYGTPPPPPPPPTPTPTPPPTVKSGDLISTSIFSRSLTKIDPASGQPTGLSDFTNAGQGPTGFPWAAVINSAGTAFATEGDASLAVVFAIDTATGNRRLLSNFADSSQGPIAQTPRGLAIEGNGNILVTDRSNPGGGYSPGLFEVNSLTGARTRISDFNNPALGPVGASPMGVALDASGFILVVDALAGTDCRGFGGCGALFRVDRSTGVRTIVSDFGDPTQGPLGGTGPNALAVDADGSFLILDNFAGASGIGALFRVNPTTGSRIIVTDYGDASQGTVGSIPIDSGVVVANGTIFAPCAEGTCKIDPVTGHRTPFSIFEGSLAVVP